MNCLADEDLYQSTCRSVLWGHSAFVLSASITKLFTVGNSALGVIGEGEGRVMHRLTTHMCTGNGSKVQHIGPTDATVNDRIESELGALGLNALVSAPQSGEGFFYSYRSIMSPECGNEPRIYSNRSITEMFVANRLVHHMQRFPVGQMAPLSVPAIERFLREWIRKYVNLSDNVTMTTRRQYPLRSATIHVLPPDEGATAYRCNVSFTFHNLFGQLPSITVTFFVPA
jgi:predicted component of type VI protein secretion system